MFFKQVGERIPQAYDCVELLIIDVPVQPAPVGMDALQDIATLLRIFKGLHQHLCVTVSTGYVETGLEQLYGMKTGTGCDIQNPGFTVVLELFDKEFPLTLGPGVPVDQLVPPFDEVFNVLRLVMAGIAYLCRMIAVHLLLGDFLEWQYFISCHL